MLDQHLYSDTYGPNYIGTWLISSKGIISVKECSEGVEWLQCRHDSTELLFPLKCAWASLHMPLFLGFPVYCMGTIVVLFGLSVFSFSLRPPEFSAFCLETCGTQAGYSRRSFSPLNLSPQTHTHTHLNQAFHFVLFLTLLSSLSVHPTYTDCRNGLELVSYFYDMAQFLYLLSVYFSYVYDCRTFVWNSVTGNKMHVIWYLAEHFWLEHSWTNQMWFETLKTPCFFNLYIVFLWSESPAAAHARGGQPSSSPLSLPRPVSILAPSIPVTSAHRAPAIGFLALRLRQTKIFYLGKPMFSAGQPLKWSRY